MSTNETLKSQANLIRLKELSVKLHFDGIRLMLDPQKIISPEAVIEDLCLYLEDANSEVSGSELIQEIVY